MAHPRRNIDAESQSELVASSVRERWIAAHGDIAESWLAQLSDEVSRLAKAWRLSIGRPLEGGSVSVVLSASHGSKEAVLKIAAPWSEWSKAEAAALELWDGNAAPRLFERTADGRALLLERLRPGTVADSLAPESVATLIEDLSSLESRDVSGIPSLEEAVVQRFRRAEEDRHGMVDPSRLGRAKKAGIQLAREESRKRGIVHGDLLTKNILCCDTRGYAAIDPNPAIGDPAYDAALWAITESPTSLVRERCEKLTIALGLSGDEIWSWIPVLGVAEIGVAPKERAEATLALLTTLDWW